METIWIVVVAGLGAGFVNAVAGGGSLISFPALMYSGLPAVIANATSTVALWPGSVASVWAYRTHIADQRRQALTLAVPSLIGGLAGSILLLHASEKVFRFIVPYLILLACALLIAQEPIGKWVARRQGAGGGRAPVVLWLAQLLISIYGGYFGAGIGILMLAAMAIFVPEDIQSANALKVFFAMVINGIALVYFLFIGAAVINSAGVMAGASVVGGLAGAHVARRLPARLLRLLVAGFGLFVAVRLL